MLTALGAREHSRGSRGTRQYRHERRLNKLLFVKKKQAEPTKK